MEERALINEGKSGNAEVDFAFSKGSQIIPVEVKAGTGGSLKSPHQLMAEKKLNVAIRFDRWSILKTKNRNLCYDGQRESSRAVRSLFSAPIFS